MPFTKEEIQRLFIEKLTGTIDLQEDIAIKQLIEEDAEMRHWWQSLQQEVQAYQAQGFDVEASAEPGWNELAPQLSTRSKIHIHFFRKITVAAALVILFISGYWFWKTFLPDTTDILLQTKAKGQKYITLRLENGQQLHLDPATQTTFQDAYRSIQMGKERMTYTTSLSGDQRWTLSVPATLDYQLMMADGTQVWLNAGTTISFTAGHASQSREVYLAGEAYFKVVANKNRPFIVHTPQASIWATGTEFNVNTYDSGLVKAALVEGSITAKREKDQALQLKPGFEVVCKQSGPMQAQAFDAAEVVSWRKGVYYFHDTPLQDLAGVLSRWYDVTIKFENDSVAHKMFSGALVKKDTLETFLDFLKISADIRGRVEKGTLYFD